MKYSRSAQAGVQDYYDDESERRRTIIAGEGLYGLPSLEPYLDDVRAIRPLTGEENELFNKTLELVKVQDQKDREWLDRMIEAEQDRMSVIRGENPHDDYTHYRTESDYILAVRALGDLSREELRAYAGWQTVVLDIIADHSELQEDVAYAEDEEYHAPFRSAISI